MRLKQRHLRLSVSKAKTFKQCKRKFYYQYILKLPTELKNYNAIGSLVHLVLELAFKRWIEEGHKDNLRQLVIEAWKNCRGAKEWKDAEYFSVIDEAKNYILLYYKKYIEEHYKEGKPIKCEPQFFLPLVIDDYLKITITGFIDRIDRIDYKTIYVLDYKTTNKVQYLDNFQLGIYTAACLHGPYKGYNIKAAYILLKHAMKLKKMSNPVERYPSEVDKMVKIAKQMDKTVNFEKDYIPCYTKLCDYCDYKARCYEETGGPPRASLDTVGEDSW